MAAGSTTLPMPSPGMETMVLLDNVKPPGLSGAFREEVSPGQPKMDDPKHLSDEVPPGPHHHFSLPAYVPRGPAPNS